MSKLSLLLQLGSSIHNFLWENSVINWMRIVTSDICNTHTFYHSVKGIIPKIVIYIKPHFALQCDKKTTLNKILHNNGLTKYVITIQNFYKSKAPLFQVFPWIALDKFSKICIFLSIKQHHWYLIWTNVPQIAFDFIAY